MKESKRGEDSVLEELVGDRDSVRNKLRYKLKDEGYTIIKVWSTACWLGEKSFEDKAKSSEKVDKGNCNILS